MQEGDAAPLCLTVGGPVAPAGEVWTKPLADGGVAVLLFNPADVGEASIGFTMGDVGLSDGRPTTIRDLWSHNETRTAGAAYAAQLAPHDSLMLKITQQ